MNNFTTEKIIKKLRKEYKGNIDVKNAIDALKRQGYDVVFYNTDEGDEIAAFYGITEILKRVNAITYSGTISIVFVNNDLHTQDKLCSLLHELGHILLKHVGYGDTALKNKRIIDMEAEAFAYSVLYPQKRREKILPIIILAAACICCAVIWTASRTPTGEVCITRTGEAYHSDTCPAIRGKEYIYVQKSEAQRLFDPCGICKPQNK